MEAMKGRRDGWEACFLRVTTRKDEEEPKGRPEHGLDSHVMREEKRKQRSKGHKPNDGAE